MKRSGTALPLREWVVYRCETRTRVYTGIYAATRDEALAAYLRGEGEVQPDREHWQEERLDAVDVKK